MTNGWYNQHSLRIYKCIKHLQKKHHLTRSFRSWSAPFFLPIAEIDWFSSIGRRSKLETFQRTRVNGMAWMHGINPSHKGHFFCPIQTMHYYQRHPSKNYHTFALFDSPPPKTVQIYIYIIWWPLKQHMESTWRFDLSKFTDLRVHGLSLGLSPIVWAQIRVFNGIFLNFSVIPTAWKKNIT